MFPGRFWLAVGSGESLNEHITGEGWLPKKDRQFRLVECVDVIRRLWGGETVTHNGLITVHEAKLYTLPKTPPPIIAAAVSPETAESAGRWADGLITVVKPLEELREVVDAFRRGGGRGKPMLLQAQVCYADDENDALAAAYDQWRTNVLDGTVLAELDSPACFDRAAAALKPEDLRGRIRISSEVKQHIDWLEQDIALGFDVIYVHQVGRDQLRFLEMFSETVLPAIPQVQTVSSPFTS